MSDRSEHTGKEYPKTLVLSVVGLSSGGWYGKTGREAAP